MINKEDFENLLSLLLSDDFSSYKLAVEMIAGINNVNVVSDFTFFLAKKLYASGDRGRFLYSVERNDGDFELHFKHTKVEGMLCMLLFNVYSEGIHKINSLVLFFDEHDDKYANQDNYLANFQLKNDYSRAMYNWAFYLSHTPKLTFE